MVFLLSSHAVYSAVRSVYRMTLGKSENYRLTEKTGMLAIIPSVLFLFVITNDLHQLAFAFNGAPSNPSNGFTHQPIYYACLVWIVGCMTFTLAYHPINMINARIITMMGEKNGRRS